MKVIKCNVRDLLKIPKEDIFNVKSYVDVRFEDGVVVNYNHKEIVTLRHLLPAFETYTIIPIDSRYDMKRYYKTIKNPVKGEVSHYADNTFRKWYSVLFNDVDKYYVEQGLAGREIFVQLGKVIWDINSDIYNSIICTKLEYSDTIDVESFIQIQTNPKILTAMENAIVTKTEAAINDVYKAIDEIISTESSLENNSVAKGYLLGSLKAGSVKQILGPIGKISEVDSTIYNIPITSSYLLGVNDAYEAMLETRRAAIANIESTETIRDSEYFARELQLATMFIESIADGDCGSTDYLEWYIDENEPKSFYSILGKYYLDPETNQLNYVKIEDVDKLKGKVIQLRSGIYCKHPNKKVICSKCFGKLANNINIHSNIGHYASVELTERISQGVLSTKHLISSANSVKIDIKTKTKGWLYTIYDLKDTEKGVIEAVADDSKKIYSTEEIYITAFNKSVLNNVKSIILTIPNTNKTPLGNIINIDINKVDISKLSEILEFTFTVTFKNLDRVRANIESIKVYKTPFKLVKDVLVYMQNNFENLTMDTSSYHIDLLPYIRNYGNKKIPLFKYKPTEFRYIVLIKEIKTLLRSSNKDMKAVRENVEDFLRELYSKINARLNLNLSLIETIVASYISNDKPGDLSMSRAGEGMRVASTSDVIRHRTIGSAYGWDDIKNKALVQPSIFMPDNKVSNIMDVLFVPNKFLKINNEEK